MIEESEVEVESDSDDKEMTMYERRFRRFIKKNKPWKKKKNQYNKDELKKEYKKEFKKDSKKTQSFATIATNQVMSNKTANFPRSILNTQRKVREGQW